MKGLAALEFTHHGRWWVQHDINPTTASLPLVFLAHLALLVQVHYGADLAVEHVIVLPL
jgi:hypothetical protein